MKIEAKAITPTDLLINDINSPLTEGMYDIAIGLLGLDQTNKGYTIGPTLLISEILVSNNQVILVNLPVKDKDFNKPIVFFLRDWRNAGIRPHLQLHSIAALQPTHLISSKPLRSSPKFPLEVLLSNIPDILLGDRNPQPFEIRPTFLNSYHIFNTASIHDYDHYKTVINWTLDGVEVKQVIVNGQ